MSSGPDARRVRHRRLPPLAGTQGPPAFHHLRQRRRWQVHADRPAALRVADDLRGSARGTRRRLEGRGHARGRHRFRAARRRLVGGARAGHHDRRGVSVLLDRQTQVHRGRYPGPRAVHAQHDHRRVDGGSRRHPPRRAQGRAAADAASQLSRLAPRYSARGPRHQQDGPGRLLGRSVQANRKGIRRVRAANRVERREVHSGLGRARPQHRAARRLDAVVRRSHADRAPGNRRRVGRGRRKAVSPAGAAREQAERRFPRLCRVDCRWRRPHGGRGAGVAFGPNDAHQEHSGRRSGGHRGVRPVSRSP